MLRSCAGGLGSCPQQCPLDADVGANSKGVGAGGVLSGEVPGGDSGR